MPDDRPPTDYAANRGPLNVPEYVRRTPDGFSVAGGCMGIVIMGTAIIGGIVLLVRALLGWG
jgi:hypothetical protein